MICSNCDGEGKVGVLAYEKNGCRPRLSRCEHCKGSGKENPKFAEWSVVGMACRLARTQYEPRLSMGDVARRMGWSVSHVSSMERGHEDPYPLEAALKSWEAP